MHHSPTSPPAIRAVGLTRHFADRTAVDGVDLLVPRGTVYGLLGHNGAGKTTLIRMLLSLIPRSSGEVWLLGHPMPADRRHALARVGALVEEPRFHPQLTGRENLRVVADVRDAAARDRIEGALERVGLIARAGDRVGDYSLGMRQRLGVARTLLGDPELLVLDEPSNGLDPAGIVEFRRLIRSFADDDGRTVFLSSHQLGEVEKVCDRAAIIDRGRVIAQGTIAELAGGRQEVIVGCDDPGLALGVLGGDAAAATGADGLLHVVVEGDPRAQAATINSRLLAVGVDVWHLELGVPTLEQRFLEITSTLGAVA